MDKDLTIEIFNRTAGFSFLSMGLLDTYSSCSVTSNAYTFDSFELIISKKSKFLAYFLENNILSINEKYFYIDSISYDSSQGSTLDIKGDSLAGKLAKRLVIPYTATSVKPEKVIYDLINLNVCAGASANRKYSYLTIQSPLDLGATAISYQNSEYATVAEEVETLATANKICLREVPTNLQNPTQQIQLYKGKDLSGDGGIEFSISNDGLKSISVERDVSNLATTAYILGKNDSDEEVFTIVGDDESGIERNEIYVDGSSVSQMVSDDDGNQTELTDDQFKDQLTQLGPQNLAQNVEVITLSGEINFDNKNFTYGVDYDVGDIVRETDETFGITKASVLTSMQETWDSTGYHLDPTFDTGTVTLIDKLKRK